MAENNKWFIGRTRYIPAVWPLTCYFDWPFCKYFGIESNGRAVIHYIDNGHLTAVWDKSLIEEFGRNLLDSLKKLSHEELQSLRLKGIESCKNNALLAQQFSKGGGKYSVDEYADFLKSFRLSYHEVMKHNLIYWLAAGTVLESDIKEELAGLTEEEKRYIISTMTILNEESYGQEVGREFKDIVRKARDKGIAAQTTVDAIKLFSSKYFWFPYEYVGPSVWDEEAVTKKVIDGLGATDEIEIAEPYDNILEKQKTCMIKYKLSEKAVKLFLISRQLTLMQDDRKMYLSMVGYYLNSKILPSLGAKLNVARDLALYLEEDLLGESAENIVKRLSARQDCYMTMEANDGRVTLEGEEARRRFLSLGIIDDNKVSDTKEIVGQCAFAGKVVGRVRVLKTSHVEDFKDGDIIVTGMTTPDFVPLLRRASAFITNEGGITCHAAIVARELKKPCIIGTKIATQVLKDGDMVEVDANKGVVRIIK